MTLPRRSLALVAVVAVLVAVLAGVFAADDVFAADEAAARGTRMGEPVDVPAAPVDVPGAPLDFPAAPLDLPAAPLDVPAAPLDFPAGDEGFHTYAEMRAEIHQAQADHPDLVRVFSIGRSYLGRRLWAAEVSDNVGVDEGEPEVLLDGLHHAREHMSVEMTLAVLRWLTDDYATDARVRSIVDSRRTWIVFMVNPDGGEYDIAGGRYRDWRKNRQPNEGTTAKGTDVNRNYAYRWRCCGGASRDPGASTYAGSEPFSAPEARALADFVDGRVVDGRQRIRAGISFHTYGRLVMYPYGYTRVDVPPDMTALDHRALVAMAEAMAAMNGYTPQQSSDLYISSGTFGGWMYGRHRIFEFVVEMTTRWRPPDERIARETSRNREAVLYLLEQAACPYRAIDKADAYCGPFFDDLEVDRGWRLDPGGSDTAAAGAWSRGVPRAGPYALGSAASGQGVLSTGRRAGVDLDGGVSTVRSPLFRLPAGGGATLRLRWWLGLSDDAGPSDGLLVRLVDAAGTPLGAPLLVARGEGAAREPAWRSLVAAIDPAALGVAGERVAIELVATDAGPDATVEAGVDSVRVSTGG